MLNKIKFKRSFFRLFLKHVYCISNFKIKFGYEKKMCFQNNGFVMGSSLSAILSEIYI